MVGRPQPGPFLDAPTLALPKLEDKESQAHCRSSMLGHLPRRWGPRGLGKEGTCKAEAWAPEPPQAPSHREGCGGVLLRGEEPGLRPACGEHPPTPRSQDDCAERGWGRRVWGGGAGLGNKTRLLSVSPDGKPGPARGLAEGTEPPKPHGFWLIGLEV